MYDQSCRRATILDTLSQKTKGMIAEFRPAIKIFEVKIWILKKPVRLWRKTTEAL